MMTDEQKLIVWHKQGSALVAAGPGTGKTHVLCCRVQYLIKRGVSTERILVVRQFCFDY